MPTNYINSLSKEHKIPVKKLEEIWEKAKQASSNKNNYGIITTIFKSMINKQFDLNENKKEVNLFITNKTMYMEENEKIKLQIGDSLTKLINVQKTMDLKNLIIKKNDYFHISFGICKFFSNDKRILNTVKRNKIIYEENFIKIPLNRFNVLDLSELSSKGGTFEKWYSIIK